MKNMKGNKKLQTNTNTERLVHLFEQINTGQNPGKLRNEANQLIRSLQMKDIKTAEQNMVEDGYPLALVQQLSDTFMLMVTLRENSSQQDHSLPEEHIVRMVQIEHDIMRYFAADLIATANSLCWAEIYPNGPA